jgi:hypothetical protein
VAANKVKRSIHLAQPQRRRPHPESEELMRVKAHVYRTIAEMNAGFEQAIQGLQVLRNMSFFQSDNLHGLHNLLARTRAQANRELMAVLNQRETANAGHFQRLCPGSQRDERQSVTNRG